MESKKPVYIITIAILILFIISVSSILLFQNKYKKSSKEYYLQGLEYYEKGDYQNAYYNFNRVKPISDLALNALYRQAKSADKLGDNKTAIKKYSLCIKHIKDENITPFFLWRIGQLRMNEDNFRLSKKAFLELKENYPNSEYGIAANYYLAKIEKNLDIKKKYLTEYLKYSPQGRFSKEIISELLENENEYELTFKDKSIIAESLYRNMEYEKAVKILKDVPLSISWIEFIKSLDKLNSSKNVRKVARKGFTFDNSDFTADELDFAVSAYIRHSDNKLKAANEIYGLSNEPTVKGSALYKSLAYTTGEENYKRRLVLFERYKDYKEAPEVLFNVFMKNCLAGETKLALKYGKMHLANYKDHNTTPAVLYFTALLKKKTSDNSYKTTVNTLLTEYPYSYYAFRAYVNLSGKKPHKPKAIRPVGKIEFPYQTNKKLCEFFELLVDENDTEFLTDFRINDPLIKSWVQYQKGDRALSSVIARNYIKDNLGKAPKTAYKLAFPVYYTEEINKYSKKRNLDPYLILALIKEESHFNPNIRSAVGATGLMQLMPSTASMIAGRSYTAYELTNEETNIALGTAYFANLLNIFSNSEELSVLSYNSGPNAVKGWLNKNAHLPFDFMVETIPYNETKEYIKKVYSAYWNYLLTYENLKIGN